MPPEHELPEDDNGDALRRLEAQGDHLTRPRYIDFTVVFPEEDVAVRFAEHFRIQGYEVSVEFAGTVKELPWDVIVVKHMTPSLQGIGEFETTLQEVAGNLGGRNDGWGCLSEPKLMPRLLKPILKAAADPRLRCAFVRVHPRDAQFCDPVESYFAAVSSGLTAASGISIVPTLRDRRS